MLCISLSCLALLVVVAAQPDSIQTSPSCFVNFSVAKSASVRRDEMSDSEDSDFSDNQSERSSDGEAEEVEENEVS